jgi:hypothetical protein
VFEGRGLERRCGCVFRVGRVYRVTHPMTKKAAAARQISMFMSCTHLSQEGVRGRNREEQGGTGRNREEVRPLHADVRECCCLVWL